MSFLSWLAIVLIRTLTSKVFGHAKAERIHKAATKPAPMAAALAVMSTWAVRSRTDIYPVKQVSASNDLIPNICVLESLLVPLLRRIVWFTIQMAHMRKHTKYIKIHQNTVYICKYCHVRDKVFSSLSPKLYIL